MIPMTLTCPCCRTSTLNVLYEPGYATVHAYEGEEVVAEQTSCDCHEFLAAIPGADERYQEDLVYEARERMADL